MGEKLKFFSACFSLLLLKGLVNFPYPKLGYDTLLKSVRSFNKEIKQLATKNEAGKIALASKNIKRFMSLRR